MYLFIRNDTSSLRTQHGPGGAGAVTCGRPQYITLGSQERSIQEAANDAYLSQFFDWFQSGLPDEVSPSMEDLRADDLSALLASEPSVRFWIVNGDSVLEIGVSGLSETMLLE